MAITTQDGKFEDYSMRDRIGMGADLRLAARINQEYVVDSVDVSYNTANWGNRIIWSRGDGRPLKKIKYKGKTYEITPPTNGEFYN